MTTAQLRTIRKHGKELCLRARQLNVVDGEGQTTISIYLGVHFNTAGALISAGNALELDRVALSCRMFSAPKFLTHSLFAENFNS